MDDPEGKLGFVSQTLRALRAEIGSSATLLGFIGAPVGQGWGRAGRLAVSARVRPVAAVLASLWQSWQAQQPWRQYLHFPAALWHPPAGTPWTLAAYSIEGKADKNCRRTKSLMLHNPEVLHALLEHITQAMIAYVGYQIEAGAQVGLVEGVQGCARVCVCEGRG